MQFVEEILDNEGRLVATVGDSIKTDGGEIPSEKVEEFIGESLSDDCEGLYWLLLKL